MIRPRPSALILLIPVLMSCPRPSSAQVASPFFDAGGFQALRALQDQMKEAVQAARLQPKPLLIPDVNFGNKTAIRYRYQRKDEVYYLDDEKRPILVGSEISDVVETSGGEVERLLSVEAASNLSQRGLEEINKEKQKAANEGQRLAKLLGDDKAKTKLMKKEKTDADGLENMVKEFPHALRYTYGGTETGPDGEELVRESFESNDCSHPTHVDPCYTPGNQEARIFEGMKGTAWLRVRDGHLARLNTSIQHDIKFGWGPFSATAKSGGYIAVTLSNIDGQGKRWIVSALEDHLTIEKSAIAAMFSGGTERDNDKQVKYGFKPVGEMSFDQGIELLRSER